jgi:hypothetical protein
LSKEWLANAKSQKVQKIVGKELVEAVLSFNPRQFLARHHEPDNGLRWLISPYKPPSQWLIISSQPVILLKALQPKQCFSDT